MLDLYYSFQQNKSVTFYRVKVYNKKKEVGRRAWNADMFCDEWELEFFSKTAK